MRLNPIENQYIFPKQKYDFRLLKLKKLFNSKNRHKNALGALNQKL